MVGYFYLLFFSFSSSLIWNTALIPKLTQIIIVFASVFVVVYKDLNRACKGEEYWLTIRITYVRKRVDIVIFLKFCHKIRMFFFSLQSGKIEITILESLPIWVRNQWFESNNISYPMLKFWKQISIFFKFLIETKKKCAVKSYTKRVFFFMYTYWGRCKGGGTIGLNRQLHYF
jgi:hypothetical protein